MAAVVERRQIALGTMRGGLWASAFLIVEADDGEVRLAFYRLRHPGEVPGGPGTPDEQVFAGLVEHGFVPPSSKREAWVRKAYRSRSLLSALSQVLDGSVFEVRTTEAYLRSTSWGADLP